MGRDDAADGSGLPAPYRNPWGALRDDLAAVAADLQLRARELWRRNGEGDLWRPRWWPRDLAPLFWPLVGAAALAAALALLGVLLGLLLHAVPPQKPPEPNSPPTVQADRGAAARPSPSADPSHELMKIQAEPGPESEPKVQPKPEPDSVTGTESDSQAAPDSEPEPDSETGEPPSPAPVDPPADPLALLLARPEASGLIEAATPQPQLGSLMLQVTPAFARLPEAEQRRRALLWQGVARELGYDHLELRDQRAGLLGRDALVGDGMILFSHQPPT